MCGSMHEEHERRAWRRPSDGDLANRRALGLQARLCQGPATRINASAILPKSVPKSACWGKADRPRVNRPIVVNRRREAFAPSICAFLSHRRIAILAYKSDPQNIKLGVFPQLWPRQR